MMNFLADVADRIGRTARGRLPAGSPWGDRLRAVRRRLPRRPPDRPIGRIIYEFGRLRSDAFIVQIGAHDGTAIDPLREELLRRRWAGILVEPVPYVFDRLRTNYGRNSRLILENAAIADADGTRAFFHLPQTTDGSLWKWYDALGSFRRDVVARHADLIPDIDDRIVTTQVPCLTFDSLLSKHGVTRVDVLQMDTEGYDLELLRMFDLPRWHPALLMFEHLHLTDAERNEARALLDEHGYVRLADNMDTLGMLRSTLESAPRLRALWDELVAAGAGDEK